MKLKKILVAVLCIAMILSTMSFTAFADSTTVALPAVDVNVDSTTGWSNAINSATDVDSDGVITYGISGKVIVDEYSIKGNAESIYIIGMTEDAELCVDTTGAGNFYIRSSAIKTVDFANITLSRLNGGWYNNLDNTNKFFTVWTDSSNAKQVNYTNCVFPNGSGNAYPGKTVYTGCKFTNTGNSDFGVWVYAVGETVIEGCTFNCNAGVKTYGYAGQKNMNTVVENSNFTCTTQPAFVTSGLGNMTINDVTVDSTYGLVANGGLGGLCNVTIDGSTPNYVAGVTTHNAHLTETIYVTDEEYIDVIIKKINEKENGSNEEPVTCTVMLTNANGTAMYATPDEAIDALAAGDNEITLLADVEQDITILQQDGINVTLNGNNNYFDGTVNINGNGRYNGTETLTIKNVNFVTDGDVSDFIYADNDILLPGQRYIYAHNVTVQDCTFTSADPEAEVCGLQFRQGKNINIVDCEFSNMHSAMWATGTLNVVIDSITADNMQNGVSAGGTSTGFVVKDSTINVTSENGYGIRTDGVKDSGLTVENNTIEAYYPVIVRNTNSDTYSLTVGANNNFTATNPDGYDIAVTAGKDDAALVEPENDIQLTIDETSDVDVFSSHAAKIGGKYYATIDAAFTAAVDGDTITLLADATPTLTSQRAITKASVIDLNGKTLTLNEDDLYFGTTTFKNGNIVVDPSVKASTAVFWMFANQTLTFDNVDITATGVTGTYLIGTWDNKEKDVNINILNGTNIIIDNDTVADLTAIICFNSTNSYVTIENSNIEVNNIDGRFYLGGTGSSVTIKNSTIDLDGVKEGFYLRAGEELDIAGASNVNVKLNDTNGRYGINLTDATANYKAADTATVNASIYKAPAADGSNLAEEVKLTFEPTDKQEVYNIYAEAVDGTINRMSAVQVKFELETKNGEDMSYTLAPASELGVTLTNDIDDEEAYVFNYNGVSAPDATGVKLLLGTVTFGGYGEFNFTVDASFNNKIKTAQTTDNIVEEYVPAPDAANEKQGKFDIASSAITGAAVVEAKRDVKVVINFNNEITAGNDADYNDMWVTLTGANGEVHTAQVGDLVDVLDDEGNVIGQTPNYTAEKAEMTFNVTAGYRYTVVVKGEGYRTARYSTVVDAADAPLVLNFWNNAKADEKNNPVLAYIEDGVDRSLKDVTFLAGDIAPDNIIDKYDLAAVVSYFGYDNLKTTNPDYVKYDLNRDGKIDADDISYVLVSWGK